MKVWEKWYWGIVLGLFTFVVVSILLSKEGVKLTKTINNQTTITYIERGKALAYFVPIWLSFFGLVWLIAKAATGGFPNKK